jgi:hypothetical protein
MYKHCVKISGLMSNEFFCSNVSVFFFVSVEVRRVLFCVNSYSFHCDCESETTQEPYSIKKNHRPIMWFLENLSTQEGERIPWPTSTRDKIQCAKSCVFRHTTCLFLPQTATSQKPQNPNIVQKTWPFFKDGQNAPKTSTTK